MSLDNAPKTKSRRNPIPYHVRTHAEPARDALLEIQAHVQTALAQAADASEDPNSDPWRLLTKLISHLGTINRLASFGVREIESIESVDRPPDTAGIQLAKSNEETEH
jgi:hypothetical protein